MHIWKTSFEFDKYLMFDYLKFNLKCPKHALLFEHVELAFIYFWNNIMYANISKLIANNCLYYEEFLAGEQKLGGGGVIPANARDWSKGILLPPHQLYSANWNINIL